ncbi:protein Mpv17 isoform X5 [Nerophis ophidion]|uniref:protein Mpv17 isoform X5 n=1 Tax=Nerophis ophidion TaxID=159077 RepID=UPI002ADF5927|nr:protein Mpv17 isoform X5 [Nerophis ophidion]
MASLWRSYQVLMGRHPWTVQIVTAGSLVGVGDVIAQQLIERRGVAGHNVRRTAKMMGVGFFFVGPVIGSWYKVLDRLVAGGSKSAAFKKMTVDQCSKRTDSGGERRQDAQGLYRCSHRQLLSVAACADGQLLLHPAPLQVGSGAGGRCGVELLLDLEGQQRVTHAHKHNQLLFLLLDQREHCKV